MKWINLKKCWCGKGQYKYASALYAYYTCRHVFERPLNGNEQGKFVPYGNPYEKKQNKLMEEGIRK